MAQPTLLIESVIGIDVSQTSLTLHDTLTQRTWTCPNSREALVAALEPLQDRQLAVCEATGGHESVLLDVLVSLGIPVHRADGTKVYAFARSLHRAKTDRIDAAMLARYGCERGAGLSRWMPPTAEQSDLTALVRRRTDLVAIRKAERTRAKAPGAEAIAASLARSIAFLDDEIAALEAAIAALIKASDHLAPRQAVLTSLPGIGPAIAANLLALLPELGTTTRRKIASLAGLAPHPDQSGTTRNAARTSGGRRSLRPLLFIAALTAIRGDNGFSHFYKRLKAAGKSSRLAIAAVMRKIVTIANARLAHPASQLT